jgi:digeranylgeranylglycerophospholipid reductase
MDMMRPDVMVVGLGPAGSRAAAAAARAGLDVVAIDRRRHAGTPVQCAEFVPVMIEREVSNVEAATRQRVRRMLTFVEHHEAAETPDFPGRMIDRITFDRLLAQEAATEGVTCLFETTLQQVEPDGILRLSDGSACRPRLVIGADGPYSRIGAAIGEVSRELVETRQVTVPLTLPHDATDVFLRADYPGGYGWLFPKGAVANIGLGVLAEERRRLKPLLGALHAELVASGRIGPRATGLTGGAIPVGGRLRSLGCIAGMPVLLAGDAAGLTNPVTGAGIASAVQSGTLAGRAAAEWVGGRARALEAYEEELGDLFDPAFARALRRRRKTLEFYQNGTRPDAHALRAGWIASPLYWAA